MLRTTITILIALFAFTFNPVIAQDDVYYSPSNDKGKSTRNQDANYEEQFNKNTSEKKASNSENYDEAGKSKTSDASKYSDGYSTGSTANKKSYYDDETDYHYSARLRRFYAPAYGSSFWDPWYTDMYYYTRDPWMWGNSIYINVIPSYNWWQPRRVIVYDPWYSWNYCSSLNYWNSPWYGNGWNNCGWNSWGFAYGWNSWGVSPWGGNNWAWNNGYWNGYNQGFNQGYYDSYYNSGGYYGNYYGGGRNYSMNGPRFQQTSTNTSGGSYEQPGKFGKTDETIVPREGVFKPGTNPAKAPAKPTDKGGIIERDKVSDPVKNADKIDDKKVPSSGWNEVPQNPGKVPADRIPSEQPNRGRFDNVPVEREIPVQQPNRDKINYMPVEREVPVQQPNRDKLNNVPVEQPKRFDGQAPEQERFNNTNRNDRMRDQINRDNQPVERNIPMEQPERNVPREEMRQQPAQRNYEAPPIREQPQRHIPRNDIRRMEERPQPIQRNIEVPQQREMRQMPVQREQPRIIERSAPHHSPRQMQSSPGPLKRP